jgi:hypothetical protein
LPFFGSGGSDRGMVGSGVLVGTAASGPGVLVSVENVMEALLE